MSRHHHILNAASNLLGITLIIITGVRIGGMSERTIADKVAWVAAAAFSVSCLLSYMAIRREPEATWFEHWADRIFFLGLMLLVLSVLALATLKL